MNLHQHIINNIQVGNISKSSIHAFGLFANTDIPVDTLLAILDGQVVPWIVYKEINNLTRDAYNEWNAISNDMLLVRRFRTKYSFINHSRSPNCFISNNNGVLSARSLSFIPAGDEMTLDYRYEPLPQDYVDGHGASYL